MPFEALDYVYMPSRDVAADVRFLTEVLGGRLVFAIDAMGARVAMVELTETPPPILLASHLAGERPILIYRVASLAEADRRTRRTWLGSGADGRDPGRPMLRVRGARWPAFRDLRAQPAGGRGALRGASRLLSRSDPRVSQAEDRLDLLGGRPRTAVVVAQDHDRGVIDGVV